MSHMLLNLLILLGWLISFFSGCIFCIFSGDWQLRQSAFSRVRYVHSLMNSESPGHLSSSSSGTLYDFVARKDWMDLGGVHLRCGHMIFAVHQRFNCQVQSHMIRLIPVAAQKFRSHVLGQICLDSGTTLKSNT